MEMIKVDSSNIDKIGYHEDEETLRIDFKNGTAYLYSNVPQMVFKSLLDAESKGKYFSSVIKKNFTFRKL